MYSIEISKRLFGLSEKTVTEMYRLLKSGKHDLTNTFSAAELAAAFTFDKKRRGEKVNFVALKKVGRAEIVSVGISDLKSMMEDYESTNNPV